MRRVVRWAILLLPLACNGRGDTGPAVNVPSPPVVAADSNTGVLRLVILNTDSTGTIHLMLGDTIQLRAKIETLTVHGKGGEE